MAGLYIHIPFCRQACHYCNFHFSTNLSIQDRMIRAIVAELDGKHDYLAEQAVGSIYIGGGTPSLLTQQQLELIMNSISKKYQLEESVEITLEANPEDINADYLKMLISTGINRLSIGIQSFDEADLEFMNRAHNGAQSLKALEAIKSSNMDQLCVDLMFGLIKSDSKTWEANLVRLLSFTPDHISCYNLTIEEQTAFHNWMSKGKIQEISENTQYDQFIRSHELLTSAGYHHYEISNFCLPHKPSKHNSNYWSHGTYLGVGPGAHSFDGLSRQWNISNNALYLTAIEMDNLYSERETLSQIDLYNEFIMLNLRQSKGIAEDELLQFDDLIITHFSKMSVVLIGQNYSIIKMVDII